MESGRNVESGRNMKSDVPRVRKTLLKKLLLIAWTTLQVGERRSRCLSQVDNQ